MALIAAPRYCQTPDNTFYASCSLSLLVFYSSMLGRLFLDAYSWALTSWALTSWALTSWAPISWTLIFGRSCQQRPRLRSAARGRFPNGACSSKVLLAVRLRHFVPAGNPKSQPLREWAIRRARPPKISHRTEWTSDVITWRPHRDGWSRPRG
jgi:hypothetical protein